MKLGAAILSCFLLLTLSAFGQETAQTPPPEIKSKVEREVFDAAKYPALAAVGRISFIGQSWCSIILVSEDIAVTAGHCILKANIKFDLKKDFDPFWTSVNFKPDGVRRIEGVSIKHVLTAKSEPDYAIVQLNKKIPESVIKPLKISKLTFDEMRSDETRLGCAGFNGDKDLGGGGFLMTISRNIKIIAETSSKKRIDTSCFSTYGGSGGLFFNESLNAETKANEYDVLGVIWGLTDEKLNENGELVKDENVVTSITPVSVFYDELSKIISQKAVIPNKGRKTEKWAKRN